MEVWDLSNRQLEFLASISTSIPQDKRDPDSSKNKTYIWVAQVLSYVTLLILSVLIC